MKIKHSFLRAIVYLFVPIIFLQLLIGLPICNGVEAQEEPTVRFWLTVLHNNDGESQLINAGSGVEDFGGVARFERVVRRLKKQARLYDTKRPSCQKGKRGVIMVSSGDNFLAGPEFNASLQKGFPFFDSIALDLIGYDAMAIGNHEFDFGPDVLADFMRGFRSHNPRFVRFLSANLDFSQEPRLQTLVDNGRIASSVVINECGQKIGIIGATTPSLPFISSPRNVVVNSDVAGAIQSEIDKLTARKINKIILISHLQSIEEDLALAPLLRGVDVMVAGGGDELLANPGNLLIPGDEQVVFGPYPLKASDADGNTVYVITTSGAYRYVGRLIAGFDRNGSIVEIKEERSGPVRVAGGDNPDAVKPDPETQKKVVEPVEEAIAALASNIIASSEVALDGLRSTIRTKESNEGNLIADALFSRAAELAPGFGAPLPNVALQNGGGIRNDTIIGPGDVTELDTFDMLPFANFVSIVPGISPGQFKEILENAVSRVEFTDGRFAQISGFRMTWDANGTAQVLDSDGNVVTPGTRIKEVILNDGTEIVIDGAVQPAAPSLNIATIDFSARGGDQYPFRNAPFITLGITYQQALFDYIVDELGGAILATDYPEGGEGRITRLN